MVDRVGLRTYASGYASQHACAAVATAYTPSHHNTRSNGHPHVRAHHHALSHYHALSNPHADTHHDDHGVLHRSQSLCGGNTSF
jgi:hypothetical protein